MIITPLEDFLNIRGLTKEFEYNLGGPTGAKTDILTLWSLNKRYSIRAALDWDTSETRDKDFWSDLDNHFICYCNVNGY